MEFSSPFNSSLWSKRTIQGHVDNRIMAFPDRVGTEFMVTVLSAIECGQLGFWGQKGQKWKKVFSSFLSYSYTGSMSTHSRCLENCKGPKRNTRLSLITSWRLTCNTPNSAPTWASASLRGMTEFLLLEADEWCCPEGGTWHGSSSSKTPIKKFSSYQRGVNSWKKNSGVIGSAAYPILDTRFKEQYKNFKHKSRYEMRIDKI